MEPPNSPYLLTNYKQEKEKTLTNATTHDLCRCHAKSNISRALDKIMHEQ